jgi:hypothetical protein
MNEKQPDDQTLWFRNLPPKASEEGSKEVQGNAEKNLKLSCLLNL